MTEKNFPLSLSFFGLMEVIWINQGNDRNYRWRNLGTRHPLITTLANYVRLSFLVESPILYPAFFKTILAALFRAFGLPLSFLPSKPSFLHHDHSTTQHSDFSSFLAISTTDNPVNRSIQPCALTQLTFLR